MATRCDRMAGNDYVRRHNEVVRCIHLLMCNRYGFKRTNKIRTHSVKEIISNENAEIKVDTRIKTYIKVQCDRPDIFIQDKKRNEIILIEVGITNQDILTKVENEKVRKYDLISNELGVIYKCKTRTIPYVITWNGIVSIYHKKYIKEIGITLAIEAYIQSKVLKKTFECITFDQRCGHLEGIAEMDVVGGRVDRLGTIEAGEPEEPIPQQITE